MSTGAAPVARERDKLPIGADVGKRRVVVAVARAGNTPVMGDSLDRVAAGGNEDDFLIESRRDGIVRLCAVRMAADQAVAVARIIERNV